MAYVAGNLSIIGGAAPGELIYFFDAVADTRATVEAAGYFNNTDDTLNLTADDMILCECGDGSMLLKVSSISSGSVTTQVVNVSGPRQTSDNTSTATDTLQYGYTEIGTGSASKYFIPAPYVGAPFEVYVGATAGTATTIELVTAATAQTINVAGDTTITLPRNGTLSWAELEGVSTTRWIVKGLISTAVLS